MQHKEMPKAYRLPIWAGMVSIAIHVIELGIVNTHPDMMQGTWFFRVQITGFVLTAILFAGSIRIFTKEQMQEPVVVSAIGHGLLIAAASFTYLKLEGFEWIQVLAMLLIFAVLVPYLLAKYSYVEQLYSPGGYSLREHDQWRQEQEDQLKAGLDATKTAIIAIETRIGQALDTAKTDTAIEDMRLQVADLQDKIQRMKWQIDKQKQREAKATE